VPPAARFGSRADARVEARHRHRVGQRGPLLFPLLHLLVRRLPRRRLRLGRRRGHGGLCRGSASHRRALRAALHLDPVGPRGGPLWPAAVDDCEHGRRHPRQRLLWPDHQPARRPRGPVFADRRSQRVGDADGAVRAGVRGGGDAARGLVVRLCHRLRRRPPRPSNRRMDLRCARPALPRPPAFPGWRRDRRHRRRGQRGLAAGDEAARSLFLFCCNGFLFGDPGSLSCRSGLLFNPPGSLYFILCCSGFLFVLL